MDFARRILICSFVFHQFVASGFGYDLTIVHNNDVHAHFEQINKYSGECSDEQAAKDECFGGEARRIAIIKEARANFSNTLVLDAGDRFTGTLWFNTYKGAAASFFVNKENYDAACLGNHEFDLGVEGLVPYLDNLTVPVLDANIDVSSEPRLQGKFNRSLVLERGGQKIGIVGFITTDTAFISSAGPTVKFTDEVTAVRNEVEKLQAAGVKIIIGLSHSGYGMDKKVAAEVDGIDVIVGGHSHTFLYTGDQPSTEPIEGPYPTVITQSSGKKVLVLQAYAWGKYMGFINVTFDENFEVQSWDGDPILLDNTIQRDPSMLADIERMKKPLERTKAKIVGSTAVRLEGDPIQCRLRECNTGNLLTDATIWYHIDKKETNETWALASIVIMSSGGIRASTEPGPISMGQVLTIQPFGNVIDIIKIKGQYIWDAFEHSVANYDPHDRPGAFLQVSGARVVYNLQNQPGNRVVSLDVRCIKCQVPTYSPIEMEAVYDILLNDWLIKAGDGYEMIKDNIIEHIELNSLDVDILTAYLKAHPRVFPEVEGRIKFIETDGQTTSIAPTFHVSHSKLALLFLGIWFVYRRMSL